MKLFSPKGRPLNRATAKNAALLNLLGTPGLGSLIARRWIAGSGQLILAVTGFILVVVWFFDEMIPYYRLMFGDVPPHLTGFKMLGTGAILFAAAWLWSAVTSIGLLREASAGKERSLKNFAAPPPLKFDESKIISSLALIPNWKLLGATIVRTYEFKDFPAAIKFVEAIAGIAEEAWHHPDIDIRWNKVTLTLTTHDAGGLTEKDFALARQFDQL
jgi:4a-hydroxytetrahydrobiopterin dehydratase